MFWRKKTEAELTIGCCLMDNGYSIAVISDNRQLIFSESRVFNENILHTMPQALAEDVERMQIIAKDAAVVLTPSQYQLLLMDAMNVPEAEMAKALRWNLKGLSEYDLDDVAIDMCAVPSEENGPHKIFVALTSRTKLDEKIALLQSAFLNVTTVTIAEMALRNLLPLVRVKQPELEHSPVIVISLWDKVRKLHIFYEDLFYLIRELTPATNNSDAKETIEMTNLTFEIERSIDYCINQLNLPEPKHLFFTPSFYFATKSLKSIGKMLNMHVELIDLNQYLEIEPALPLKKQQDVFFSIISALTYVERETENETAH